MVFLWEPLEAWPKLSDLWEAKSSCSYYLHVLYFIIYLLH